MDPMGGDGLTPAQLRAYLDYQQPPQRTTGIGGGLGAVGNTGIGGGGLSQDQMRAYLDYVSGQGSFEEQDRELQRQMAAAQALRDQQSPRHTTGIGGGLGAVGNMLSNLAGARQMNNAQQEDKLLQLARVAALRKMANASNPQPQSPGMMGATMGPGGGAYILPGQ